MISFKRFEGQLALIAAVVLILLGEWLLLQQAFLTGILVYSLVLLLLLVYVAYRWSYVQHYLLVLTIPAIIRMLNFTLPMGNLAPLFAQVVIAFPLALTTIVFVWLFQEDKFPLYFRWRQIPLYLLMIVLGSGVGFLLFQFRQSQRLVWNTPLLLGFYSFVLVFAMAVLEEWLFRGIMQTALSKFMGEIPGGLLVALVYTIMHINQGPWTFVLVIFLFALGLSWLQSKSKNLLNVCLVHSAANLFFFLILPWR